MGWNSKDNYRFQHFPNGTLFNTGKNQVILSRLLEQKTVLAVCGAASVTSAVFAYIVWFGPKQEVPQQLGPEHKATRRIKNAPKAYWLTTNNHDLR